MKVQVWELGKYQIIIQEERFMGVWFDGSEIPATKINIIIEDFEDVSLSIESLPVVDMGERKIEDVVQSLSETANKEVK